MLKVWCHMFTSLNKKLVKVSCAKQASVQLNKKVNRKWSEWSKRGFACSQPLNKKLVKTLCAKRLITKRCFMFPSLNKKFQGFICKQMFTSLNKKLVQWSNSGFACELVEFCAKWQIRQEQWKTAALAGYKVGEGIAGIGAVAVLRFSYRDHRLLKQISKLEANQIHQTVRPVLEQHVVVTRSNTTQLKWPGRISFTLVYNEWKSF